MSSNDYRSALDTPDAPRAGCYALPSWALALHFGRREKEVTGPKASAPPSAAAQAPARATDAAGGTLHLFARPCEPGCGCAVCVNFCRWCAASLPPLAGEPDAVVRAFGRLCRECARRQEEARSASE